MDESQATKKSAEINSPEGKNLKAEEAAKFIMSEAYGKWDPFSIGAFIGGTIGATFGAVSNTAGYIGAAFGLIHQTQNSQEVTSEKTDNLEDIQQYLLTEAKKGNAIAVGAYAGGLAGEVAGKVVESAATKFKSRIEEYTKEPNSWGKTVEAAIAKLKPSL